ncbi:MAG: DNA methyltransferase [Sphingomicrobium sp.]
MNLPQSSPVRLAIEYLPPNSLTAEPSNARSHKPPQIAAIARSIQAFGFNVPLLIDGDGNVIAGHGRLFAAKKIGLTEVPTIRLEHLSDAQRKAYMIADNRLTDLSKWDDQLLGQVLRDLSVADLDFELDAIGFSVGEIDFHIEALGQTASAEDPADGPIELGSCPVSIDGDLWQLGPHRLLCGSALDPHAWDYLMAGQLAAVGFTDPPFNVKINGHVSGLGVVQHREFSMASGEMDRGEYIDFLESSFRLMARHSAPASIHFTAIDWRHVPEMVAAGEAAFSELKNICVWSKPAGGMGALYRSQHELFFVWKSGRGRHRNNVELGRNGRSRTNIWSYPSAAGFRHSEGGDLLADHPTCKPVALVADALLDVSKRGDIVIDPFMGIGSSIIAAERVGRLAYGMELDPLYVDGIIRRFEKLTGQEAINQDGRSFAEVTLARQPSIGAAA